MAGTGATIPIAVPNTPNAPTTQNSGVNIVIDWTAPSDNGSAITAYKIEIKHGTSFTTELSNCDGTDGTIVSNTECTIP